MRVFDDGVGGARLGAGSGLIGLRGRVRAVDGELRGEQPGRVGRPCVDVELPVHP